MWKLLRYYFLKLDDLVLQDGLGASKNKNVGYPIEGRKNVDDPCVCIQLGHHTDRLYVHLLPSVIHDIIVGLLQ